MKDFIEDNLITLKPIGIIHSPYQEKHQAPRQGRLSETITKLEIFPKYTEALKGIEKVSHLYVLYWGHQSQRETLASQTPFSETPVGVFASRSPNRPNPIAICIADLLEVHGNTLTVRGVDALDGSPLLDIKVYDQIDNVPNTSNGNIQLEPSGKTAVD
jgi:tRNA-Thr(GGU) m(6)t(6)A37 methyltransferase TsaA